MGEGGNASVSLCATGGGAGAGVRRPPSQIGNRLPPPRNEVALNPHPFGSDPESNLEPLLSAASPTPEGSLIHSGDASTNGRLL